MKITIRRAEGGLSVYIPKKDLEARVIATDPAHAFGGRIECVGGLTLYIEPMKEAPPVTRTGRPLQLVVTTGMSSRRSRRAGRGSETRPPDRTARG